MTQEEFFDWFTSATPSQFLLGVLVLVFGSRQILSEKNVKSSLGGLLLPAQWIRKRRESAAKEEASEIEFLRREIVRLTRENLRQHRWSVEVSRKIHSIETWAAGEGLELPPPPFRHLHEYPNEEVEDEE